MMSFFLYLLIGQTGNQSDDIAGYCRAVQFITTFHAKKQQRGIMEDRWLSVSEIALYLGIKRDTIYKWIGRRSMPSHKVGRLWKFRQEEVDAWVRTSGGAGLGYDTMPGDSQALLSPSE
jgi:excisionase family DNA binding protein